MFRKRGEKYFGEYTDGVESKFYSYISKYHYTLSEIYHSYFIRDEKIDSIVIAVINQHKVTNDKFLYCDFDNSLNYCRNIDTFRFQFIFGKYNEYSTKVIKEENRQLYVVINVGADFNTDFVYMLLFREIFVYDAKSKVVNEIKCDFKTKYDELLSNPTLEDWELLEISYYLDKLDKKSTLHEISKAIEKSTAVKKFMMLADYVENTKDIYKYWRIVGLMEILKQISNVIWSEFYTYINDYPRKEICRKPIKEQYLIDLFTSANTYRHYMSVNYYSTKYIRLSNTETYSINEKVWHF